MLTRATWIAGLTALAAGGALAGVAQGVGFAYVQVSVPKTAVPSDRGFHLGFKGHSSKPAELDMFVSTQACRANAELETVLFREKKATRPVHHTVHGDFAHALGYSVDKKGKHYACAYLYEVPKHPLARDEASWHVT